MKAVTITLRFDIGDTAVVRLDPNEGERGIAHHNGERISIQRWHASSGFDKRTPYVSYTVQPRNGSQFRVSEHELREEEEGERENA